MEFNVRDKMLEEIDEELEAIDARLKKVLSETDLLLKEWKGDTEHPEADSSPCPESIDEPGPLK